MKEEVVVRFTRVIEDLCRIRRKEAGPSVQLHGTNANVGQMRQGSDHQRKPMIPLYDGIAARIQSGVKDEKHFLTML